MRGIRISVCLALTATVGAVGCKSMPSLTWWKTASKTEMADSTAVAHSAPALPSEVALQTENVAPPTVSTVAAAPYVSTGAPAVSTSPYPSTSAPPFKVEPTAPQVASAAPAASAPATMAVPANNNVGSIAMPYNPNSVPPVAQTAATMPVDTGPSRYGSLPNVAPGVAPTTPPVSPPSAVAATPNVAPTPPAPAFNPSQSGALGSRYANTNVASTTAPAFDTPVDTAPPIAVAQNASDASYPQTPVSSTPVPPAPSQSFGSTGLGDRYSQAAPAAAPVIAQTVTAPPAVPTAPSAPQAPVAQTAAMAEPYRPGGTSSYPSGQAQPAYQIATRPEAPTSAPPVQIEGSVPNVTVPSDATQPTHRF